MQKKNPFSEPKIAADYDAWYHGKGKASAEEEKTLLKKFIEDYKNAKTILEIGCGTGYFSDWFNTLGFNTVGVDSANAMLRHAQEIYDLSCVMGEAKALPFDEKAFDLVAMITTLEFITHPKVAIKDALRVARYGVILGVLNKHSLLGWRYHKKGGPVWGQARLFTTGELQDMMKELMPKSASIGWKTTLWLFFSGSSKLPWGGFIVMAAKLQGEKEET